MHVTLHHIEDVAHNIKTFWFVPDEPVRYTAGQFTAIELPLRKPDRRGRRHWFTISSSPTEDLLGITTKFTPARSSTFKHALQSLQPGGELILSEPMGDFVLPQDPSVPLLFAAGGIGITPMRSMIKWLHDSGEQRDIQLLYSVKHENELAFRDLFEAYDLKFTPVVTEPDTSWSGETGWITAKKIVAIAREKPESLIYLAGPEPMVEKLVGDFQDLGIPRHRLVTDYFPGYKSL